MHPMRSNREMTSTMREAKRTMIALQGGCSASHGHGMGVPSAGPSPEESHFDGSTLCLVPLVPGNKVVDEGETDVEHKDYSRRQQGPQVKGQPLLQYMPQEEQHNIRGAESTPLSPGCLEAPRDPPA